MFLFLMCDERYSLNKMKVQVNHLQVFGSQHTAALPSTVAAVTSTRSHAEVLMKNTTQAESFISAPGPQVVPGLFLHDLPESR